jgi:hypothetical protein
MEVIPILFQLIQKIPLVVMTQMIPQLMMMMMEVS